MESEDNFSDGVLKTRPVLTDVTNRPAKRPFSLISGDDGDSQFAKQVCSGIENLVKKKCQLQFGAHPHQNNNENVLSQSKGKQPCFKLPGDGREEQNLLGIGVVSASNEEGSVVGFGEKGQGRTPNEGFIERAIESGDEREHCVVENLGSPNCGAGAVELPAISASRDSKFLGLERCSALKGDGGAANSDVAGGGGGGDLDLLKTCTCSFCSKAAYIWSDLHYQDVKGRLSALKKSQKEASMVLQKFSALKDTVIKHNQQSSGESSKLELSLMHQWKSLFVHMDNQFTQEIRQLESSFETLKDLRENCKNDLELTDNSHFDSH